MTSRKLRIAGVLVGLVLGGCFDPEDQMGNSGQFADGTTSGSTGQSSTAGTAGTAGNDCSGDADCADSDPCSIDTCDAGACTHTPNVDDPACACTTAADCTQLPADDECRTRACNEQVCSLVFTPRGTPRNETQQTAEDCQLVVCDGAGGSEVVEDATDVPIDGLECTADACDGDAPINPPARRGTPCAAGTCDGDGGCTGCMQPAECGGQDTFCATVTCEGNVCGVALTPAGTPLPDQTPGDCRELQCDGRGNEASIAADGDLPADDGNECTAEVCQSGDAVHVDHPSNTACTIGGTVCDGAGACVECNDAAQCGGASGCMVPACANHTCGLAPADAGTPCSDGLYCTGNDTCNGAGACIGGSNPCPGPDGDNDCSETCDEVNDACSANDPNNTDCGNCRHCTNGSCIFECGGGQFCCEDGICIDPMQDCP